MDVVLVVSVTESIGPTAFDNIHTTSFLMRADLKL
jgi:hypothetical protein